MICATCEEEVQYLINIQESESPEQAQCGSCFETAHPEFGDSIREFQEILELFLEHKSRCMTQEEMHELYGNENTEE